jgi:hypothetical protein
LLNCEAAGQWTRRMAHEWWRANSETPIDNSTAATLVEALA